MNNIVPTFPEFVFQTIIFWSDCFHAPLIILITKLVESFQSFHLKIHFAINLGKKNWLIRFWFIACFTWRFFCDIIFLQFFFFVNLFFGMILPAAHLASCQRKRWVFFFEVFVVFCWFCGKGKTEISMRNLRIC